MSDKKKKKGSSTPSSASKGLDHSVEVNPLTRIKEMTLKFLETREKSILAAENVVKLLNKKTFMQIEKTSSVSALSSHSSFALDLEEEFLLTLEALRKKRFNALLQLQEITGFTFDDLPNISEIDLIKDFISQLNQQSLLDEMICDQLLSFPQSNSNQDELVTMMTCIKLTPYLKEKEIKAFFLELK
jgi:hypothetical protein